MSKAVVPKVVSCDSPGKPEEAISPLRGQEMSDHSSGSGGTPIQGGLHPLYGSPHCLEKLLSQIVAHSLFEIANLEVGHDQRAVGRPTEGAASRSHLPDDLHHTAPFSMFNSILFVAASLSPWHRSHCRAITAPHPHKYFSGSQRH